MRAFLATMAAAVLVTALASSTVAAPKQRNQVSKDATRASGAASPRASYARGESIVTFGNRGLGWDPDPNIRLQMLRDPYPGNY